MKITKWVDMGQEVEVEVGIDDIRTAMAEAFENVTHDRMGEDGPTQSDVIKALNRAGLFLKAMTDEQVRMLSDAQAALIADFLYAASLRFKRPPTEFSPSG